MFHSVNQTHCFLFFAFLPVFLLAAVFALQSVTVTLCLRKVSEKIGKRRHVCLCVLEKYRKRSEKEDTCVYESGKTSNVYRYPRSRTIIETKYLLRTKILKSDVPWNNYIKCFLKGILGSTNFLMSFHGHFVDFVGSEVIFKYTQSQFSFQLAVFISVMTKSATLGYGWG